MGAVVSIRNGHVSSLDDGIADDGRPLREDDTGGKAVLEGNSRNEEFLYVIAL